jgi:hypothetical protein
MEAEGDKVFHRKRREVRMVSDDFGSGVSDDAECPSDLLMGSVGEG